MEFDLDKVLWFDMALKWWLLIFLAILVAIGAGIGGFIYYRNQNR